MADVDSTDVRMAEAGHPKAIPDPIKSSYDVFIKPRVSGDRQIYVLQFPNRDSKHHYSQDNESQPQTLRVKPESGMVEVDVPVSAWHNFDREKGVKWGDALKKNGMAKGGGSHGLPGGFGIGSAQPTGRGRGRVEGDDDLNQEALLADYAMAVQRDQVLKKQALGGQYVLNDETSPQYMIGVWRHGKVPNSRIRCIQTDRRDKINFILRQLLTSPSCALSFTISMLTPSKSIILELERRARAQHALPRLGLSI
jgi:DNA-directed RNA polymerase-3 subunit RPC5